MPSTTNFAGLVYKFCSFSLKSVYIPILVDYITRGFQMGSVTAFVFDREKGTTFQVEQADIAGYLSSSSLLWVNIESVGAEEEGWLEAHFKFHHLALEDCRHEATRPKIENYKDYIFIVFDALNLNPGEGALDTINLNIFLGRNYVVSIHSRPLETVKALQERLRGGSPLLAQGQTGLPTPCWAGWWRDISPTSMRWRVT